MGGFISKKARREFLFKLQIFLTSFVWRQLMTLLHISRNQSYNETQSRGIPFLSQTIKVPFIQMPYIKISPQNPPGNKNNITLIFITSKQICKRVKDILILPNGMLCTDWWANTDSTPVWHTLKCRTVSHHQLSLKLLVGMEHLIS